MMVFLLLFPTNISISLLFTTPLNSCYAHDIHGAMVTIRGKGHNIINHLILWCQSQLPEFSSTCPHALGNTSIKQPILSIVSIPLVHMGNNNFIHSSHRFTYFTMLRSGAGTSRSIHGREWVQLNFFGRGNSFGRNWQLQSLGSRI